MIEITTYAAQETAEAGCRLGRLLNRGDVVCLAGALGTGKTAFTGGIAAAIDIQGYITSPTFTIVNEYQGRVPLYHFDVYRIADPGEMFEVGFDEYIEGNGIVVIEWADLITEILPHDRINVHIERNVNWDKDKRVIRIEFCGEKYRQYEGRFDI